MAVCRSTIEWKTPRRMRCRVILEKKLSTALSQEVVLTMRPDARRFWDALVWAFTELLVEPMKGVGIYELYRQMAEAAAQRSKPQPAQTVPQPGSTEWFEARKKQG